MLARMTAERSAALPAVASAALPVPGAAEQLSALLKGLPLPGVARDGDCLVVAARVTAAAQELGFPADTVTVIGWLDWATVCSAVPELSSRQGGDELTVIGFSHRVTVVSGWVLDATAQQFRADLPARWIAPLQEYLQRLAAVTGVARVTVAGSGPSILPERSDRRLT